MSEKDRTVVGPRAVALLNGVDLRRFQPCASEPEPNRILFIGAFQHLPNLMAVRFFLEGVWPALAEFSPKLHVIAGRRPQFHLDRYRDRAAIDLTLPGIEIEEFVSDVRPAYQRAAIVIAPLLASAGTNIKIMEAMAMGKAIVSTPAGINGLDLESGRDVIVVNTASEMAEAIAELFEHPDRRKELEQQARRTAEEKYDWDLIAADQKRLYDSLR
jgi:glycosyltransferase involved in cell wall biosynthesis